MLNLIRADLYRVTRLRGLRGQLPRYGLLHLAFALLLLAIMWAFGSAPYIELNGALDTAGGVSLTAAVGGTFVSSKVLVLCCVFGSLGLAFEDMDHGFLKSVCGSLSGRLSYYVGRILFAGVWSLIMLALATIVTLSLQLTGWLVFGGAPIAPESIGTAILWYLEVWFSCWTLASLLLLIGWVIREKQIAYLGAWLIPISAISNLVQDIGTVLAAITDGPVNAIANTLVTVAPWAPSHMLNQLQGGAAQLLDGGAGGLAVQAGVVALAWFAGVCALTIIVTRRSDIAR